MNSLETSYKRKLDTIISLLCFKITRKDHQYAKRTAYETVVLMKMQNKEHSSQDAVTYRVVRSLTSSSFCFPALIQSENQLYLNAMETKQFLR